MPPSCARADPYYDEARFSSPLRSLPLPQFSDLKVSVEEEWSRCIGRAFYSRYWFVFYWWLFPLSLDT